jgi:hypothetical protein
MAVLRSIIFQTSSIDQSSWLTFAVAGLEPTVNSQEIETDPLPESRHAATLPREVAVYPARARYSHRKLTCNRQNSAAIANGG